MTGPMGAPNSKKARTHRVLALLFALGMCSPQALADPDVDLTPQTLQAFDRYVQVTERRNDTDLARPGTFLHIEALPEPGRSEAPASVRKGEIYMEQLRTPDSSGRVIEAPGGLIHHWVGAVFIPGVALRKVLDLVEDYDHHENVYKPEVVRSRLLKHEGNDYKIYYRLRKKKVITVTLNTEHDVQYFSLDATHCRSRSVSTRIAEVVDADQRGEREKPVGHDSGFLWRMNSYWRFEEKDQGVYVEVESISLTRDIPTGLGWLIRPFITGIPRESLLMTLGSTRSALAASSHAGTS